MANQAGRTVPISWRGRSLQAFVPALLAEREPRTRPSARTVAAVARASAQVAEARARIGDDPVAPARLQLRTEATASCLMSGIRAPALDILMAEAFPGRSSTGPTGAAGPIGITGPDGDAARRVVANQAALIQAVGSATPLHLTQGTIGTARAPGTASLNGTASLKQWCDWHRLLMEHEPVERYASAEAGELRDGHAWVGASDPADADLVAPPARLLPGLLEDLVAFVNRDELDPVTQAALAHAQLATVRPFAHGNGRLGRILATWVLARRMSLPSPPLLSLALAEDLEAYRSALTLFRSENYHGWVEWWAQALARGAAAQTYLVDRIEALMDEWVGRLENRDRGEAEDAWVPGWSTALRPRAIAWKALRLVPHHPVLTTSILAEELFNPNKTLNAALRQLAEVGVLTERGTVPGPGRGRPATLYVSTEMINLALPPGLVKAASRPRRPRRPVDGWWTT